MVDFNGEDRKISLSIKALQADMMRAEEAADDVLEENVDEESAATIEE